MKTANATGTMRWVRMALPLSMLLILTAAALTLPRPAKADVRLRADIRLPHVSVQVRAGDRHVLRQRLMRHAPLTRRVFVQHQYQNPVRPWDHKVARKLARKTGYSKRLFMELRQAGYSWKQIGYHLNIAPRLIRRTMRQVNSGAVGGGMGGGHYDTQRRGPKRGHR